MVYKVICDMASFYLCYIPLAHSILATPASFLLIEQVRHTSALQPLPLFALLETLFT